MSGELWALLIVIYVCWACGFHTKDFWCFVRWVFTSQGNGPESPVTMLSDEGAFCGTGLMRWERKLLP